MNLPTADWFDDNDYWHVNRNFIWSRKRIEMSGEAAAKVAKLLELEPGDSVLDLACGFGRYSIPLSEMGYSVTGVDLDREFIQEAADNAAALELDAQFECADMREYSRPDSFDAVMLMYNSFGYFRDPADDEKVLRNCYLSLRPGGRILLHNATRELIRTGRESGTSRYWYEEEDGTLRLEEATINDDFTWNTTRWIIIRGADRREYRYGMRIYGLSELKELLAGCGFVNVQTFGNLGKRPFDASKDHLFLLASRRV
jgi:SAM-dependent methyltransferase